MTRLTALAICFVPGLLAAAAASNPTFFARIDYAGLASSQVEAVDVNGDGILTL